MPPEEISEVRQFFWGVVFGLVFWWAYERVDPPAVLEYLTSATESAARSTSGYGGKNR
jgi:hypothetical protein